MILAQEPEAVAAGRVPPARDPFSLGIPVVEIGFTKWIGGYPAMTGFTSDGPGTLGGEILSRIDDGVFTHLVARYEVTDSSGAHSFKAVIQGTADDRSGHYELYGIVTGGWMMGSRVHVRFDRRSPCRHGALDVCFQGTIRIQRGQARAPSRAGLPSSLLASTNT
jgi:hypothetical protein